MRRLTSVHTRFVGSRPWQAVSPMLVASLRGCSSAEGRLVVLDGRKRATSLAGKLTQARLVDDAAGTDYERAVCFLTQGDPLHARQALIEEIRTNPSHHTARRLLQKLEQALDPAVFALPPSIAEAEPVFAMLYDALRAHTMLTWTRMFALYAHAKRLCDATAPDGDVVECGCAGGGSVVLIAATLKHFGSRPRRVFACDTFSGMPPPTKEDVLVASSLSADATHWSTGTCSSSEVHVQALARAFGVDIQTVCGLFQATLPPLVAPADSDSGEGRAAIGSVALLHCDADWFESTRCILEAFAPKMVSGGIVQFDDYHYWEGCRRAVDDFLAQHGALTSVGLQEVDGNAVYLRIP